LKTLREVHQMHGNQAGEQAADEKMVEVAMHVGGPGELALALSRVGRANLQHGRFREARSALELATDLAARMDGPLLGEPFMRLGEVIWLMDEDEEAVAYLRRWGERALSSGSPSAVLSLESTHALIEQVSGRPDDACRRLLSALDSFESSASHYYVFRAKRRLASAMAEVDAAASLDVLEELESELSPRDDLRDHLWHVRAAVLKRLGHNRLSKESFERSLKVLSEADVPVTMTEIHLSLGLAHAAVGDVGNAMMHLEESIRIAETIGAAPYCRRARRALEEARGRVLAG
jgi:tetratricopeptide (TPR) repeat protein